MISIDDILHDLRGLFLEQEWITPEHYRQARDYAWAHEAELVQMELRMAVDTCIDPACPHPECEEGRGHAGRHTVRCDDGSCCEPPAPDPEEVARLRQIHFGE